MKENRENIKPEWERFSSRKQRGEWVELQFMAQAALRRFIVSRPWGESQAYDVGVEHESNFLRVQVKSTTSRGSVGYRCQFRPSQHKRRDYCLEQIDLFAAYVIPEDVWYLIPASLLVGENRHTQAVLCPLKRPRKPASYRYERYRDAWPILTKTREELARVDELCRQNLAEEKLRGKIGPSGPALSKRKRVEGTA